MNKLHDAHVVEFNALWKRIYEEREAFKSAASKHREALAENQRELSVEWQKLEKLQSARLAENREHVQVVLQEKVDALQSKLEPSPPPRCYPEPLAPNVEPMSLPVEPAGALTRPLTTTEIASCFAGFKWDVEQWKKVLTSQRVWLVVCRVRSGSPGKGGAQSTWLPVEIAKQLVRMGYAKPKKLTARFNNQEALKPWLDAWLPNDVEAA